MKISCVNIYIREGLKSSLLFCVLIKLTYIMWLKLDLYIRDVPYTEHIEDGGDHVLTPEEMYKATIATSESLEAWLNDTFQKIDPSFKAILQKDRILEENIRATSTNACISEGIIFEIQTVNSEINLINCPYIILSYFFTDKQSRP